MHGWKAFQGAVGSSHETAALINLAQLLLEAGHARPALRGFAAALVRNPVPRHALPTLGGAACAAAAALPAQAARALIRNFADRVQVLVQSLGDGAILPFPSASALVEISEALSLIHDEAAAKSVAEQAGRIARSRGYHELVFRLENPPVIPTPAKLAPATSEILQAVDELEGAELVGVA
jgi:hypothetical protein